MAKSTKRKQKRRKQTLKRKRGGCGCGNTMPILGGSPNLAELPIRYYYDYNDNPSYLSEQIKGGRRKKRKMNGGASLSTGINSFGTFMGIPDTYRVINAAPTNDYIATTKYIAGNVPPI